MAGMRICAEVPDRAFLHTDAVSAAGGTAARLPDASLGEGSYRCRGTVLGDLRRRPGGGRCQRCRNLVSFSWRADVRPKRSFEV